MIVIILNLLCAFLLVPSIILLVEVMAAIVPGRSRLIPIGGRPRRIAVLIPAHDEERTIAGTLQSLVPQLNREDRLVVVADNCSDRTAEVARANGAEVIVRHNRDLRGKGYALDCGIRHLEDEVPDVVIVIDADCLVTPGSIAVLAAAAIASGRPIQALYKMRAPKGAGLRMRIAEFAWLVKNHVRPLGLHRMGFPCQLMGTGMAFPWAVVQTAPLATDHLVEDLKLGLDLAQRRCPPLLCMQASVSSEFPNSSEGIHSQRTRWEHGHLRSILADGPKLLLRSISHRDARLAAMALDLCVPPLALLAMVLAGNWAICLSLAIHARALPPILLATLSILAFCVAVTLAWRFFGRRIISGRDLALASIYAICKAPLYLRFVFRPQSTWVRSKR